MVIANSIPIKLDRYCSCGKCGGFLAIEKDNYGTLINCLNCSYHDYLELDRAAAPYQIDRVYKLNVPREVRQSIRTSGYSSWLPEGIV